MKKDEPKEPTAIRGHFSLTLHPLENASAIANCLENQFTPYKRLKKTMNGGWRLEFKLCSKL
jgi:hypothetical protein